jgi:glycosyltransferase involved in cell wall biosynthesis
MFKKKLMVVSAVNLVEGGTLSVMLDALTSASAVLDSRWRIITFVHKRSLVRIPGVKCIELPSIKKSWLKRLALEWFGFWKISRRLEVDLWLSMHDITPTVKAKRRAVYCHNPAPFHRIGLHEAILDPKFLIFRLFYKYVYRVNIKKNFAIIVQQSWIKTHFEQMFNCEQVLVAQPSVPVPQIAELWSRSKQPPSKKLIFIFPALPRVFKNFETLCKAVSFLEPHYQARVEILFTISGNENAYSRALFRKYHKSPALRFIGAQNRKKIFELYQHCDGVLFPSRLETWGLPITEAKIFRKPLFVSDLPYAREAVGNYDRVKFIDPVDPREWAKILKHSIDGDWLFESIAGYRSDDQVLKDWDCLWLLLTSFDKCENDKKT